MRSSRTVQTLFFTIPLFLGRPAAAQPAPEPAPAPPDPGVAVPSAIPAPVPTATTTDDSSARARLSDDELDRRIATQLASKPHNSGWNDGFFVESDDGKSRIKLGGILQFDARYFPHDDADPHTDQFAFRTIRPDLSGTLFDHYDFRILPDFAGGKLVIQEAYADVRYSNAVKLRFGKFKVPFGLERLQLEVATTFVERGFPTQLAPNRDLGIQLFGELADDRVEYQVGVFNGVADGQIGDGDVSDDKEVAARVFVKPFITTRTALRGLGVGGAVTYGKKLGTLASPDVAFFRTEGQNTFFAYKVGTTLDATAIADGNHLRATVQGYYYLGPIGVLGEWVRSQQHVAIGTTKQVHQEVDIDAWQAVVQWVITGDDAGYKSVSPRHPFDPDKGQWGAFDIAARFSELIVPGASVFRAGLADPTRSANQARAATVGVDWFLNKNVRLALDYDHAWYHRGAKAGDKPDENSIITRFQTYF
ncbi:MAG TPA: porin [Kofleriaceae bacterium]|nr:porin [Kofleriaceae bacterium]